MKKLKLPKSYKKVLRALSCGQAVTLFVGDRNRRYIDRVRVVTHNNCEWLPWVYHAYPFKTETFTRSCFMSILNKTPNEIVRRMYRYDRHMGLTIKNVEVIR